MQILISLFFSIATLRKSPADVPYSVSLLVTVSLVSLCIDMMLLSLPSDFALTEEASLRLASHAEESSLMRTEDDAKSASLLIGLAYLVISFGGIWGLFRSFNKQERFVQAFTALSAASVVHSASMLLFFVFCSAIGGIGEGGLINWQFGFFVWGLMILTHVFRRSLELTPGTSILISIGYFIILQLIVSALFVG